MSFVCKYIDHKKSKYLKCKIPSVFLKFLALCVPYDHLVCSK